jgi:diphthine-ammonia ligase
VQTGILLFSGGKDCILALEKARRTVRVVRLLHLHTTLPEPSPHTENAVLRAAIVQALGLPCDEVRLERGREREILVDFLRSTPGEVLVAADIFLEAHRLWWEEVCARAGKALLEPLWGRATAVWARQWGRYGISFVIVGLNPQRVPPTWLGRVVGPAERSEFLEAARRYGFDPCGENGEFHTMALSARSFRFSIVPLEITRREVSPTLSIARVLRWRPAPTSSPH